MIAIRYKAWLAPIYHPMACLFLKLKNATLATLPLVKEYMPPCSTWQRYASRYLIKSALSRKTGPRFTFRIQQLLEGRAVKGKGRNNSWFRVWKGCAILLV